MCIDTQITIEETVDIGKCGLDGSQGGHEIGQTVWLDCVLSDDRRNPLIWHPFEHSRCCSVAMWIVAGDLDLPFYDRRSTGEDLHLEPTVDSSAARFTHCLFSDHGLIHH